MEVILDKESLRQYLVKLGVVIIGWIIYILIFIALSVVLGMIVYGGWKLSGGTVI